MRSRKRRLGLALALMFAVLLALPAIPGVEFSIGKAVFQDASRNDVKPKEAIPQPPQSPTGSAPANDNCANAVVVACPFTDTISTTGATNELGEPSPCGAIGNAIWYSFTNTSANVTQVTVTTCNGSAYDTAVAAYREDGASCDFTNFTNVACNDDSCGLQTTISFLADPGATYKIQAGGFAGSTGNLIIDITCLEFVCPPIVVNGTLGSGSPDYPSVSGNLTPARLFRDGIPSTCAVPKVCPGTFGAGSFLYDAYTFTNESGETQCVTVDYEPNIGCGPNAHATAYMGSFVDTSVCTNYLADSGSSDNVSFSFDVPDGATFVIVISANTPGVGTGCAYRFTVTGNICLGFDFCVQDDAGQRFLEFSSETGDYRFTRCVKGPYMAEGTGTVTFSGDKIVLFDGTPGSRVNATVNVGTRKGVVQARFGTRPLESFTDSNIDNNTCECP